MKGITPTRLKSFAYYAYYRGNQIRNRDFTGHIFKQTCQWVITG